MKKTAPPRLAYALLSWLLDADRHNALLGDLKEGFNVRQQTIGRTRASFWFWRETFSALREFSWRSSRVQKEPSHDSIIGSFLSDIHFGSRALRKSPVFTTVSCLTLALGIGATAALFSVVNPILIEPLPYRHPERLMFVYEKGGAGEKSNTTFATFTDLVREARTIESASLLAGWQPTLTGDGDPEQLRGQRVSAAYFHMLGVQPILGRLFTPEEDSPDHRAVILSYNVWMRRFGGDSSIVGRTISISNVPFVVAGVMPRSFENVSAPLAEIWRSMGYAASQPWACRTCRHLRMLVRVRDDVEPLTATTELDRIATALSVQYPRDYPKGGAILVPMREQMTAAYKPALYALFGAAILLGLIAAANVVNLNVARTFARQQSLSIRVLLGANRVRIARLLLAEGLVLGLLAAVGAAIVAWTLVPLLASQLPQNIPRLRAVAINAKTFQLIALAGITIAIVLGIFPALRRDFARTRQMSRISNRIAGGHLARRGALVVFEVALAVMLLSGTLLLSRTLSALMAVDSGLETSRVLTMQVQANGTRYDTNAVTWNNHLAVIDAIRAVPGVEAASVSSQLPLSGNFDAYVIQAQDKPLANPELAPSADRYTVTPSYFDVFGIRALRGRLFNDGDNRTDAAAVAIVSASLAQLIWPGEDALGKRVRVGGDNTPWREIVGVVNDVHHRGLDDAATIQFYAPEQQWERGETNVGVAVKVRGNPRAAAAAIRAAVKSVDPHQTIQNVAPMTQLVADSVTQRRLAFVLFAAFAGVAVLLAGAGVYGVLASNVTGRARDIGVRAALGATPQRLVGLVARDSARLIGIGAAAGLAGVFVLSRFLNALLFGVGPNDPVTLIAVVAGISTLGVAAAVIPAHRAANMDPSLALRADGE